MQGDRETSLTTRELFVVARQLSPHGLHPAEQRALPKANPQLQPPAACRALRETDFSASASSAVLFRG